jgi:hypothetical protein
LVKAVEVVEAAQRAITIGRPFNRHLTVHWEKAGLTDAEAARATGRLLKLIKDWARRHGGTAYTWVREKWSRQGEPYAHTLACASWPQPRPHESLVLQSYWLEEALAARCSAYQTDRRHC